MQIDEVNLHDTVKRRVLEYNGKKDQWFNQWFLPTLDRVKVNCLSWESIIETILGNDPEYGEQLQGYYNKGLDYNGPSLSKG